MGHEPENTLVSFEKAIKFGLKMIEFDVYKCKSEDIVIIHDDTLNRTTNGSGYIWNKTLKELKGLKIKNNIKSSTSTSRSIGQEIPTLIEALNLIDRKCKVNIELKGKNTAKPVFEIIKRQIEEEKWKYSDFLISSFSKKEIIEFQKFTKKIKTAICIKKTSLEIIEFAKKEKLYSIHPGLKCVNEKFVNLAHKNNFKIYVWTVNEKDDFEKMKKIKVDGIFTNYPDKFLKNIKSK